MSISYVFTVASGMFKRVTLIGHFSAHSTEEGSKNYHWFEHGDTNINMFLDP